MKRNLFFLLVVLVGFSANAFSQSKYISMSPVQFQAALESETDEMLIDVRQDWEFKKGHLESALNIDIMSDDFDSKVSAFSKDTPLYVYCFSGGRSAEASEKLKAMGFKKVVNLTGGISAWEKAFLPVVK